ncbi:MAG: site-specific integrase [Anaerohalosphaera sp.]|nr:site-specific integrase [Anaerohalosphaera sp.]
MAIEKVGIYSKWLGDVPEDNNGNPLPRTDWPRKRRRKWVVRWYSTDNKKRYGKVFKTRKEAERCAAKLQNEVHSGRADRPIDITLHGFLIEHEAVMKGQVAIATLHDHIRALTLFENFIGGSTKLIRITARDAEAFIASRLELREIETANKDIRTLRSIFNRAINPRGYLQEGKNPFAKIKERKTTEKEVRYVAVEEYRKLMEATDQVWWKTVLAIAYGSGLRHNEILHLTWADVDFDNQKIHVRPKKEAPNILKWDPKSRKKRTVSMSDESCLLLANLQAEAKDKHPYAFITPERLKEILNKRQAGKWHERKAMVNNVTRDFHVIRNHAGIDHCILHDLRRSAITRWAERLPIQVVQYLAGHSNITTTRKYYLAVRDEDLQVAIDWTNKVLRESLPTDTKMTPD